MIEIYGHDLIICSLIQNHVEILEELTLRSEGYNRIIDAEFILRNIDFKGSLTLFRHVYEEEFLVKCACPFHCRTVKQWNAPCRIHRLHMAHDFGKIIFAAPA